MRSAGMGRFEEARQPGNTEVSPPKPLQVKQAVTRQTVPFLLYSTDWPVLSLESVLMGKTPGRRRP
jgi:hypothetical protein